MAHEVRAYFFKLCILELLLINNCFLNALQMNYDSCVTASGSYQVGGWCFYSYSNSSWAYNTFGQNAAQTVCAPYGNLAVGVTYKAQMVFANRLTNATHVFGWIALVKDNTYNSPPYTEGWYWNPRMPDGSYARIPSVTSNIAWYVGNNPPEPNNGLGGENSGVACNGVGIADSQESLALYAHFQVVAICQFTAREWTYSQRGHGRFASSSFLIAQMTCTRLACIMKCHRSPGCVSFAYNPTTNDCQTYAVSPEDPKFSTSVTSDAAYDWYIRDGLEY